MLPKRKVCYFLGIQPVSFCQKCGSKCGFFEEYSNFGANERNILLSSEPSPYFGLIWIAHILISFNSEIFFFHHTILFVCMFEELFPFTTFWIRTGISKKKTETLWWRTSNGQIFSCYAFMQIFNNTLVLCSLPHFLWKKTIWKKKTNDKRKCTWASSLSMYFGTSIKGTQIPNIQSKTVARASLCWDNMDVHMACILRLLFTHRSDTIFETNTRRFGFLGILPHTFDVLELIIG